MSWADEQWVEWGAPLGWYKSGVRANGSANILSMDVQLKNGVGAIVEGTVDVLEPLDWGTWRVDIVLPGYIERWEAKQGSRTAKATYLMGDHAGDAGAVGVGKQLDSVKDLAEFAVEYLHHINLVTAYSSFRKVMRHF